MGWLRDLGWSWGRELWQDIDPSQRKAARSHIPPWWGSYWGKLSMAKPHVVCFPFSVPSRFLWFPPPQPGHCLTVTFVPWHCLQNFWDPHPSLVPQAWRPIPSLHPSSPRLLMPSTKTLPWGPSCPPKWHLSVKGHRNLFIFLEAGEALVPSKAGEGECIPENQLG